MHVRPMDKKDVITVAAWLAGAVIWDDSPAIVFPKDALFGQ